jgi:hypothetical protein
MNEQIIKIMEYIKNSHAKYEPKDRETEYLVISKELNKLMAKPLTIERWQTIVDKTLTDAVFFFVDNPVYKVPERQYSVVLKNFTYKGIEVVRVITPLDNDVQYNLTLGAGLTMPELAFMLAFIIEEMDESKHCSKDDMLKLINTHLSK